MRYASPPDPKAMMHRDSFLKFLVILLVINIVVIIWHLGSGTFLPDDLTSIEYNGLVLSVMLLLNHVAFQYHPKPQWKSTALKAVALVWLVGGTLYIMRDLLAFIFS